MKIQALVIAVALAAGSAFAAAPNSGAKGDAAATPTAAADTATPAKKSHKKVAKKHHASTHAKASRHGTHAMGAGPSSPVTDVQAPSRQARIDQAYANWQSRQR